MASHKRTGLGASIPCLVLLAVLSAIGLVACGRGAVQPTATASAGPRSPNLTVSAAPPSPASTADSPIVLTWWVPDFLVTGGNGSGAAVLAQHVRDFEAAQGGKVRVNLVSKARHGKGGLVDLLRTAQPVAPGVLPDLVVFDTAELAAANGALQPLEDVIDPAVVNGLYPFALQAGRLDGHILAVPFWADVEHLAYDRGRVTAPPATWAEVVAGSPITYTFPLGSPQPLTSGAADGVQGTFVSQYLSAGGALNPETYQLALDEGPLLRVLEFYNEARMAGVLSPTISEIAGLDDSWHAFTTDGAPLANVSARRYLMDLDNLKGAGYAPMPGYAAPAVPVASSWAMGIVSADPAHKRAAADLVTWLLAPERLGPWSQAADWLPTSPAAWQSWGNNPYYDFLQRQLAVAVHVPGGLGDAQIAAQLQKAITAVLRGHASPKDAVRGVATPAPPKG